jgi:DNA-binding GntR family transcriptional regulator
MTVQRRLRIATHGVAVRSLPEQIADDLGASIARGDFAGGDRLLEVSIAERYGVSRGPAREALRLLASRGLAMLYPRRGAFVVEVSLDSLVDLFETRADLMGLATRNFAIVAPPEARAELEDAVAELSRVSVLAETDSLAFTSITSRISGLIYLNCASPWLRRLIDHQNETSAWRSLWQSGHIDFDTRGRRQEAAADYAELAVAISREDGAAAEAGMRHLVRRAKENAISVLSRLRDEARDGAVAPVVAEPAHLGRR